MISRKAPLEENDFAEILEREIEEGAHIEQAHDIVEDSAQSVLGGLISAEEHVHVHELPSPPHTARR